MNGARPGMHVERFELFNAETRHGEVVTVTIDAAALAGLYARKARENKSRRTRLLLGAVEVAVAEVER